MQTGGHGSDKRQRCPRTPGHRGIKSCDADLSVPSRLTQARAVSERLRWSERKARRAFTGPATRRRREVRSSDMLFGMTGRGPLACFKKRDCGRGLTQPLTPAWKIWHKMARGPRQSTQITEPEGAASQIEQHVWRAQKESGKFKRNRSQLKLARAGTDSYVAICRPTDQTLQ